MSSEIRQGQILSLGSLLQSWVIYLTILKVPETGECCIHTTGSGIEDKIMVFTYSTNILYAVFAPGTQNSKIPGTKVYM